MENKPTEDEAEDLAEGGADAAVEDASFEEELEETDLVAEPAGPAGRSRLVALLAGAALVLAVAALAAALYVGMQAAAPPAPDVEPLRADISTLTELAESNAASLEQLGDRLAALGERVARLEAEGGGAARDIESVERALDGEIGALRQEIDQALRQGLAGVDADRTRLAALEESFAALQGISTGVRDTWHLAEAEYYLQIGNAQLDLAGNPELALLALRLADDKLRRVSETGLTDVRRALAEEIRALESIEAPDVEGATLTLANLAGVVDSLPLDQDVPAASRESAAADGGESGVDRALASLKNALSDVVTVRRTDEPVQPLMAPEAAYFLRANLSLQLQAARLALLRGERAAFEQSLDDAARWLREYYDIESAPVKSALLTLSEIRNNAFVTSLPDISGSLALLRQHMEFRQATEGFDPGAGDEPQQ